MANQDDLWPAGPTCPRLAPGEVHVWRAVLDLPPARQEFLARTLTPDERARAERLRFAEDRVRFVAGRGLLRTILGRCLDTDPAGLRFVYNPAGKPALAGDSPLRFNVSHTGGLALYALSLGREVGVDLELVRLDWGGERIADRFFSPREAGLLRALPAPQRPAAFFRAWARKEAYLKARGLGLSLPLDSFSVSLEPGVPAALLEAGDGEDGRRWSLADLAADPACAAALAVQGHGWRLQCWSFEPDPV